MKKCRWWVRSFAVAAVALLTAQLFVQLAQPVVNTWRNQHISSDVRATVLSMSGQVNMLGQLGGGLAVGLVGNRYGIRAALCSLACSWPRCWRYMPATAGTPATRSPPRHHPNCSPNLVLREHTRK
jgi:hypothetical protein